MHIETLDDLIKKFEKEDMPGAIVEYDDGPALFIKETKKTRVYLNKDGQIFMVRKDMDLLPFN